MSLKTGFAQIFSCCPKNLSCPKFGEATAPLAPPPPARTPTALLRCAWLKNETCITARRISDTMKQEGKVNQPKHAWIVDITFRGRSENILTWRRVIQRCISGWYFSYFSSRWYQVGQCYLLWTIHMLSRVNFMRFGLTTCKHSFRVVAHRDIS